MASRTNNTKRNIIASYALMIIQIIFQFVSRSLIVHYLGKEYLGLSSLFTSILQVLNVAESGFSLSIIYFMYKPLAYGDTDQVCALLKYLNKIYKIVGFVVFGLGTILVPFLRMIIKGDVPTGINITALYFLYLINTSLGYFLFAYKSSLLSALQRLDLTKIAHCVVMVLQYTLQIVALVVFQNYYFFVVSMIIGTILLNLLNSYICNKKFPQYECRGQLSQVTKNDILKKVRGLLICNISGVTYTTFDSITISFFIGLNSVAIYNNYLTIETAVATIVILIRNSMQASVGNIVAVESVEKNYEYISFWQFLFSGVATWCATCMICLFQPFMKLWMGETMLLPFVDVILLGSWFFLTVVQQAFHLYLGGAGLWDEMKWIYIFSTVFNLVMNIILGRYLGITGIILATLLSTIIFGIFGQCIVIFKSYFKISANKYIIKQLLFFLVASIIVSVTYFTCTFVSASGWRELIIKIIICLVVPTALLLLITFRSKYYSKTKELLIKLIK